MHLPPNQGRRFALRIVLGGLVAGVLSVGASTQAMATPSWSIVPSPNSVRSTNVLDSVSCVSPSFCMAVGGGNSTLIESWNGASWSILASAPDSPSVLTGVSCVSPSFCMAVGSGSDYTIIESWNGTTWSVVPSPPAGFEPSLNAVSCVSPVSCQAVGDELDPGLLALVTLTESWDGNTWSVVPSPNPGGIKSHYILKGVSCVSPSWCQAVGDWGLQSDRTLIESWNGSTWSILPKPNKRRTPNQLNGVSCISPTSCTAVGYAGSKREQTFVESWNGAKWSVTHHSHNEGVQNNALNGVSCVSATSCEAVGQYSTRKATLTLVDSWNGTTWTITPSPNNGNGNDLNGVACVSATSCQATGEYGPVQSFRTLIESYG